MSRPESISDDRMATESLRSQAKSFRMTREEAIATDAYVEMRMSRCPASGDTGVGSCIGLFELSDFVNKIDWIIYNSNWNFEKHVYQFKVPENKCIVIKNAIEEIDFKEKPRNKVNLIYHTTPWRGLVHLLKVFKKLNLNDVELNVCSSTVIYGKKFNDAIGKNYELIFTIA